VLPALFRFLARLPLPVLHNLGALAGWLAWLLVGHLPAQFHHPHRAGRHGPRA
jgi:lauroyl/myristoyl acyltransferase